VLSQASPSAFTLSLLFETFITLYDALGDWSCVIKYLMHFLPWKIDYHSLIPLL
jgi:hypothetical protein